ncbi:MAG: hypothetical protein LBC80_03195 [Treponema sp.]|jgi:hypothetical protein|nr:hypothetical protein [Treponema sp.]
MLQQSLNELYSEYLAGELARTEFEGSIYSYLIYNQEKTCLGHWKRDDYEDYISWFYPRLRKAIDSYKDVGASFDAYIAKVLLISSKEYRVRITSNEITEYSSWSAQIPDFFVREETVSYMSASNTPANLNKNVENVIAKLIIDKKGRRSTRRILALILKCYYYVSDDFAEAIAPRIGIDSKELIEKLDEIRSIRQKKDDAIFYLKERIYTQFLRCHIYEKKLSLYHEKDIKHNKLKLQYEKAKQRLEKMRKRLSVARKDATNQQIAEIIGISKGTVDASLHRLKAKWKLLSKNADLN